MGGPRKSSAKKRRAPAKGRRGGSHKGGSKECADQGKRNAGDNRSVREVE